MIPNNWEKLNKDLERKMKGFKYSFYEAVGIIGCGEKTLRRYMDDQFVKPIKVSDEWLFTNDMIDKVRFILKAKKIGYMNAYVASGLYDFLQSGKKTKDFDDIYEFIEPYIQK